MTSKTFKSALNPTELEVGTYTDSQVVLAIGYVDGEDLGVVYLAPSDAPALALAILEAAGVENVPHDIADGSERALGYLIEYVGLQQANERHAKEQAELEAEALELRNEYFNAVGSKRLWTDLNEDGHRIWLAVARKARELRAEK